MGSGGFDMINRNKDNSYLGKKSRNRFKENRISKSKLKWNSKNRDIKELSETERKDLKAKSKRELIQLKIKSKLTLILIPFIVLTLTTIFMIWMML